MLQSIGSGVVFGAIAMFAGVAIGWSTMDSARAAFLAFIAGVAIEEIVRRSTTSAWVLLGFTVILGVALFRPTVRVAVPVPTDAPFSGGTARSKSSPGVGVIDVEIAPAEPSTGTSRRSGSQVASPPQSDARSGESSASDQQRERAVAGAAVEDSARAAASFRVEVTNPNPVALTITYRLGGEEGELGTIAAGATTNYSFASRGGLAFLTLRGTSASGNVTSRVLLRRSSGQRVRLPRISGL